MAITVCPAALQGTGKCRDAQCRLRHDVVHCKPCKCFVLHGELATHRRREDHRIKCGFGKWKTDAGRPARAILPSTTPYGPKFPKPSKKRTRREARKEKLAGLCRVSVGGGEAEAQHLSVTGEEGLDFKSEVGISIKKKKDRTIPVVIQKIVDKNVSLTLVDVVVTGAGSQWFRATPSPPMKIKGKTPRTIHVSFVPTAPGEWYAQLTLRFLHVSSGKSAVLEITRALHGVATSSVDKPQGPTTNHTGGVRASQRQLVSNTRHNTGRDSPKSY